MGNRIFVAVVLLLWASTMSWLVVEKILPPFFSGDPPAHGTLVEKDPVCWQIEFRGEHVGYAVSQAVPGAVTTTEIYSRVLLEDIPLREMAPQWMSSIVDDLGLIRLDCRSRLALDSLGNLSTFETRVQINDLPLVIKAVGHIEGPELRMTFVSGGVSHEVNFALPNSKLLDGELIPQSKLLQVYVGRKWQVEMFSMFRPPNNALSLLQAEVVAEESISQRGEKIRAKRIEFRELSAAGVAAERSLRARVWVAESGAVVRQDVFLMNSQDTMLRFERRSDPEAIQLANDMLDLDIVATLTTPRN
jgi:hypothetical protein